MSVPQLMEWVAYYTLKGKKHTKAALQAKAEASLEGMKHKPPVRPRVPRRR
jgi:hypothetical protein